MALTLHGKTITYEKAAALVVAGIRGEEFVSKDSCGHASHLPTHQIMPRLARILRLTWYDAAGELVLEERQKVAEALRARDERDLSLDLMLTRREQADRLGRRRLS